MIWYFGEGFLTAQDTLSYDAYCRDREGPFFVHTLSDDETLMSYVSVAGARRWAVASVASMLPLCILGTILMLLSPIIIPSYLTVEEHLAQKVR